LERGLLVAFETATNFNANKMMLVTQWMRGKHAIKRGKNHEIFFYYRKIKRFVYGEAFSAEKIRGQ
jgi:hypothetical protein